MIDYACHHCGASMTSPDQMTGEVENCPSCGKPVRVPGQGAPVATATSPRPAATPRATGSKNLRHAAIEHPSLPERLLSILSAVIVCAPVLYSSFWMLEQVMDSRFRWSVLAVLAGIAVLAASVAAGVLAATPTLAAHMMLRYQRMTYNAIMLGGRP